MKKEKIAENITEIINTLECYITFEENPGRPEDGPFWYQEMSYGERPMHDIFAFWPYLNWGQKMALLTVVSTGYLREGDIRFTYPTVEQCLDNYKNVVKAFKTGRRIPIRIKGHVYINYIDNDLDKPIRVHHNPDRVVNLMSSRVEILWNTEYEYVESDLSLSIRDIRMREYSKEECYHSSFFIFSIFHAYFH